MIKLKVHIRNQIIILSTPGEITLQDLFESLREKNKLPKDLLNKYIEKLDSEGDVIDENLKLRELPQNQKKQRIIKLNYNMKLMESRINFLPSLLIKEEQINLQQPKKKKNKQKQLQKQIQDICSCIEAINDEESFIMKINSANFNPEIKSLIEALREEKSKDSVMLSSLQFQLARNEAEKQKIHKEMQQQILNTSMILLKSNEQQNQLKKIIQDTKKEFNSHGQVKIPEDDNPANMLKNIFEAMNKNNKSKEIQFIAIKSFYYSQNGPQNQANQKFMIEALSSYKKKNVKSLCSQSYFDRKNQWIKRGTLSGISNFILLFRSKKIQFGIFSSTPVPNSEQNCLLYLNEKTQGFLFVLGKKLVLNPKYQNLWKCSPYQFTIGNKNICLTFGSQKEKLKCHFKNPLKQYFAPETDIFKEILGNNYPLQIQLESLQLIQVKFDQIK